MHKTKELQNFTYFGISHKGSVRKNNEDRLAHIESVNGDVFILCDGMGGIVGGEIAAQITIDSIEKFISEDWAESPQMLIKNAIDFANNEVYTFFDNEEIIQRPGTTLALVLVRNNKVYYAHVGDSKIFYQTGGKLFPLTTDHSYVMNLVENNIISEDEAREHPRRNEITKAIGIQKEVDPVICKDPLNPVDYDIIFLCSDGLSNELTNKDILGFLLNNREIEIKAKKLIIEALENGGSDNVTVQLIRFYNTGNTKDVKFENLGKDKKYKYKLIFFSLLFLIISVGLFIFLSKNDIKIENIARVKKNTNSSLLIFKKSTKDTIITIYFSDNQNLQALLTSYNLTDDKIEHTSSLVENFGLIKYYIPVKSVYKHQVGKFIFSYPGINTKNIIDIIIVNNKNELYFKAGENIIVP